MSPSPSTTLSSPESCILSLDLHASPCSSQIFHYAKGQPYIDEVGTFKERIQWVGDPQWKDGSIVIHNLDYSDNGTFTCDVKNPPDIVGKTSQVTLYVFEKGVRGDGTGGLGGNTGRGLGRTERLEEEAECPG